MNDEKKSNSLISDKVTVQTLRDFLASPKPPAMTPVDILHVIQLTLRKAEDHPIFDSQQTLSQAFNVDAKTIVRSQQRLEKIGWLSRPQRRGRTNALSLNIENIPTEKVLRSLVTSEAKQISVRYQIALQKMGRKKFPKAWLARQFVSAQRILDTCGGDMDLVARLMTHALNTPQHRNKATKSLYELLGRWPKVVQSYGVKQAARQEIVSEAQAVQPQMEAAA
jgi:hypothetical protein